MKRTERKEGQHVWVVVETPTFREEVVEFSGQKVRGIHVIKMRELLPGRMLRHGIVQTIVRVKAPTGEYVIRERVFAPHSQLGIYDYQEEAFMDFPDAEYGDIR